MSFILDALKKSESERQQQGSAEFAQVPVSHESGRPPLWLWVLGALLAVNLIVLAGVLLRPAPEPLSAASTAADTTLPATGFAEQVEIAMQETPPAAPVTANAQPAPTTIATGSDETSQSAPTTSTQPEPMTRPEPPPARAAATPRGLPDVDQLRASGELPVGELRLDIHVYSDAAADRFVFINMVKHREGSTTSDGLSVDLITPDGVVLTYRGRQFLLPRQ